MSEKKHIKWISYVKIIGIILVVLGHSFHEYPDGVNGVTFWLYRFIYSFHMPLFVFISGMVLSYSCERKNCEEKYYKFCYYKFQQLIISFIVLGIIVFPFRAIMSFCADNNISLKSVAFFLIHYFILISCQLHSFGFCQ